jgi:anhydro-N-acetylmuramic acid kinase
MSAPDCYIGLMSGTSLDGVDAALVRFDPDVMLLETHYCGFDEGMRAELLALHVSGPSELDRAARLALKLSAAYADAVTALLAKAQMQPASVKAIGCHGQTIRHRPELGYTIQLNQPAALAERTGITVVADFRSRDIAAGGQGAPLVPAFHDAMFSADPAARVVVNIGGIANVTNLPGRQVLHRKISGFDTGPGNLLMDAWISSSTGHAYDRNGSMAASGKVTTALLSRMLADPYFLAPPPKSTGRDQFNREWLQQIGVNGYPPEDIQATLAELTASSIASSIRQWCTPPEGVYVCGGGAHNGHLMRRLEALLAPVKVTTTLELGVDPDWVEAMAFAWLAMQCMEGRPGNVPEVTGAAGPRILGAIYPA